MEKSGKIVLILSSLGSYISREVTKHLACSAQESRQQEPWRQRGRGPQRGDGGLPPHFIGVLFLVCRLVLSESTRGLRKQLPSSFYEIKFLFLLEMHKVMLPILPSLRLSHKYLKIKSKTIAAN